MHVNQILETCLYVDDLHRAEEFYCRVLGLKFASRQPDRHVFLRCGKQMLLLFNPAECNDANGELPPHGATGPGHVAFSVADNEIDLWRKHLDNESVVIEQEVTWPTGQRSLYFRDPAGNSLELASPRIWGFGESPARQDSADVTE